MTMLKKDSSKLIKMIVRTREKNVDKLSYLMKLTRKQFWYELSILNEELVLNELNMIKHSEGQLLLEVNDYIRYKSFLEEQAIELCDLPDERIYFLLLYITCKQDFISNIHLQEFLQLSRNAVMLDLKKLRVFLEKSHVELKYNRIDGYELLGNERDIRRLMEMVLSKLKASIPLDKVLSVFENEWNKSIDLELLNKEVVKLTNKNNLDVVHDRLEEFIYLLAFIKYRKDSQSFIYTNEETQLLKGQKLFHISKELAAVVLKNDNLSEILFWESRLLGVIQGDSVDSNNTYFIQLTEAILLNFQSMIGLSEKQTKNLKGTLYQHIVPAYFRIKFDVYYHNPLLSKIKEEYTELFELTKRALLPLEKTLGTSISESEVAYFTIHFGGYIAQDPPLKKEKRLRALVICPNGISSSLIMASTIRETFPEIDVIHAHSLDDMKILDKKSYDLIFSTMYLPTEKRTYLTSPLLNPLEREVLREQVGSDFSELRKQQIINAREILKIVENHVLIKNKEDLLKELQNYVYGYDKKVSKGMKNLQDILNESLIRLSSEKMNWKDSIRLAAQPLLEQEYIEEDYVEAMIETVEKIGPYIVLAPKVAVPHARPERGVNKLGLSLLKLDHPVDFNISSEEDPERYVELVFVLAAIDGEAHLKALIQLSKILEDDEHIEALLELDSASALYEKIKELVQIEGG